MRHHLNLITLAGAVALALGPTAAMAAAPDLPALPGQGKVVAGSALAGTPTAGGAQTISVGGNTVIAWGGGGADLNPAGTGGFNVGTGAELTFVGGNVLNVDASGQASHILGKLKATGGHLYVANGNGIIVGAGAQVHSSGAVGLIANQIAADASAWDGTAPAWNGTGGDASVAPGAAITGSSVLVTGGGIVNVDVGRITGALALRAGLPSAGGGFTATNAAAQLSVSGGNASLAGFQSAGSATNAGDVKLGATATFNVAGAFRNSGRFDAGTLPIVAGALDNSGVLTAGDIEVHGAFTNSGQVTGSGGVDVVGGNFGNDGSLSATWVFVTNGSLANRGLLVSTGGSVFTESDSTLAGFTPGADYSIVNSGTIRVPDRGLHVSANAERFGSHNGDGNDSTGSVTNTGSLELSSGIGLGGLGIAAHNDVTLGGSVQNDQGAGYAPLSASNLLQNGLGIWAAGFDFNDFTFHGEGTATLATDVTGDEGAFIAANRIRVMANLASFDRTGKPTSDTELIAGAQRGNPLDPSNSDYAIRVALGKTVTAHGVHLEGLGPDDHPNVILQGQLFGNEISLGLLPTIFPPDGIALSDVFVGPEGGIVGYSDGTKDPYVSIFSAGRVKVAPYLNVAGNFRYNGLPIGTSDGSPLTVEIDPSLMQGTPVSGLNLLARSDVTLLVDAAAPLAAGGSAVTGVDKVPNTHLVLQSTGSIKLMTPVPPVVNDLGGGEFEFITQPPANGDSYWPGYVYLGTVAAGADGRALPGTLGAGSITTTGNFSNVLPGDIDGASGIHFITQFPLNLGGAVVTNANAQVSFGTASLAGAYASALLSPHAFYGGTQGAGAVVNYGPLDASRFMARPPVDAR